ncbi:hypothetical protein EUX98_g2107 [Antrodiella citrinella]|uniref:XPG-I domain-containing protein n=1 Tax=Antrodiella citrinella TaxID=2447956 RepID=A0A4S4N232_9APHY|nr:hypothetical protein EUX98_g2107 [Antrodiella citrinella]
MPHKYRHVLGWYRIVKELQESEVEAVCVFDGLERSFAKHLEVERRRKVRRMTAARGVFEAERFKRLRNLATLSHEWVTLELTAKQEILTTVHAMLLDWKPPTTDHLVQRLHIDHSTKICASQFEQTASDVDSEYWMRHAGILVSSSQDIDAEPFSHILADIQLGHAVESGTSQHDLPLDDYPLDGLSINISPMDQLSPSDLELSHLDDVINELASSECSDPWDGPDYKESFTQTLMAQYIQYQQSIPRLESLPAPSLPTAPTREGSENRVEYAMSKNQQQLTVDEGRFWEDLSRCSTPEEAQSVMRSVSDSLAEQSHILSQSYDRRTHPPTLDTYEESKEILRAMGVPCIETSGPFEAEALASSLVLHGHADYVVSEDSDVIVYEVPLLRNLTSRKEPLVVISGAEVRSGLQLDRAGFVDFALLLGTDFSQRIKNVGPQRALKFIREYGSIERVLENERQYPPRTSQEDYLSQVARARLVFETLPPAPDVKALEPGQVDDDAVNIILRRYNLQREISDDWEYRSALAGNYFQDNPSASHSHDVKFAPSSRYAPLL